MLWGVPDERESRQSKRRLERDVYKNILIVLDESQAAERALDRAIAMAEIEKGDLFVVVVNEGVPLFASIVWGVSRDFAKILEEDQRNLSRRLLDDAKKQAQSHSIRLHSALAEGKPANSILEAVHQVHADLLVFGINHHLAFGRVIFGSTAIELARQASCDVLGVH
jgi:nucleotide-binding universal stress UspA family protein